jgi:hypothetical protein
LGLVFRIGGIRFRKDTEVEGALEEILEVIGALAFRGSARRTTN